MPIYEYECRDCGVKYDKYFTCPDDSDTHRCEQCGGVSDKLYSLGVVKVFEAFTTSNILPDGTPVTVRSQSQLSQLENKYRVRMADRDAPPPQTSFD